MIFTITLPEITQVPEWACWVIGVVIFYMLAGTFFRFQDRKYSPDKSPTKDTQFWNWAFSPVLLVLFVLFAVVFALIWLLSAGYINLFSESIEGGR